MPRHQHLRPTTGKAKPSAIKSPRGARQNHSSEFHNIDDAAICWAASGGQLKPLLAVMAIEHNLCSYDQLTTIPIRL